MVLYYSPGESEACVTTDEHPGGGAGLGRTRGNPGGIIYNYSNASLVQN